MFHEKPPTLQKEHPALQIIDFFFTFYDQLQSFWSRIRTWVSNQVPDPIRGATALHWSLSPLSLVRIVVRHIFLILRILTKTLVFLEISSCSNAFIVWMYSQCCFVPPARRDRPGDVQVVPGYLLNTSSLIIQTCLFTYVRFTFKGKKYLIFTALIASSSYIFVMTFFTEKNNERALQVQTSFPAEGLTIQVIVWI